MKTISLFNHKGGVGKTTLTINIADTLVDMGFKVLMVDADPQCNLTSFFLDEKQLDALLGDSGEDEGGTLWSAILPVVDGTGPIRQISPFQVGGNPNKLLLAGDVLLADYEEELPSAWTGSFARRERDYNVVCALPRAVRGVAAAYSVDIVLYDVGPNVGPLNRTILMDSDYFATPVAADLFSLRALSTVGRSITRWIRDWETVRGLASEANRANLLKGQPCYVGYITSAYKVSSGRVATHPHEVWEAKIAPRVTTRIANVLREVNPALVVNGGRKIGAVKNFQSLAPQAQALGLAIGKLRGHVNPGYNGQIAEAADEFLALTTDLVRRMGLNAPRD